MTDAELLELYVDYYDAFVANVAIVITLIFAYLVASYVSAQRLNISEFYGAAALFSTFTINTALGAQNLCLRAHSLQLEIVRRIELEDSSIAFVSKAGLPEFLPDYILIVSVVSVLLAVGFAFSQRRRST